MFDSYFSDLAQVAIASALLFTLAGFIAFHRQRDKTALICVLIGAFLIRLFAIQLDPFLHMWDEAIHAVVAKSMTIDPFKPMIYREEALGMYPPDWTGNHVWVHKQPFFLWLIAASIKLLGTSVFALRLPSAIMTTALVYFTHGIANELHGRKTAFISAILIGWSYWVLMVILGVIATDHNDAVFITLVGGSFWAWFAGRQRMSLKWAVVIGLFAGLAVLTKWLPGLVVYAGWGLVAIWRTIQKENARAEWGYLSIAFITTMTVSLPWQLYAWLRFPEEMGIESRYNTEHLFNAVENHAGKWDYHLNALARQLDPISLWFVLGAFLMMVLHVKNRDLRVQVLSAVILVHVFFGIVATKMENYTLMLLPFFVIGVSFVIDRIASCWDIGKWSVVLWVTLIVGAGSSVFQLERIQLLHTEQSYLDPYQAWYRNIRVHNLRAEERLAGILGKEKCIVFNVPYPSNMSYMFFNDQQVVVELPSKEQIERLERLGYRVVVVDPPPSFSKELADRVSVILLWEEQFKWW